MTDTRPKHRRPAATPPRPTRDRQDQQPPRHVGDVLELDRECELGSAGERAVVTAADGRHMTLVFPYRVAEHRMAHTSADYAYLREV